MPENQKILEVVRCFTDANNMSSPAGGVLEARGPLYRIEQLQKEMPKEDFSTALRLAAVESVENGGGMMAEILNREPEISNDPAVRAAVEKSLASAIKNGWESEKDADGYFANIFKSLNE